jgi:hypothetical protein
MANMTCHSRENVYGQRPAAQPGGFPAGSDNKIMRHLLYNPMDSRNSLSLVTKLTAVLG